MLTPDNGKDRPLNVYSLCEINPEQAEGLRALLNYLFSVVGSPLPSLLEGVLVVPQGELPDMVNRLVQRLKPGAAPYVSGENIPLGVAVPIELEDSTVAYIVLDEQLVKDLTSTEFFVREAISTILEEILHIQLYSRRWDLLGWLSPPQHDFACRSDLLSLAMQVHDEYIVIRQKCVIVAREFHVRDEQGNTHPLQISYGASVSQFLDRTMVDLRSTTVNAGGSVISMEQAWTDVLDKVYRGVFEPLARNAAFSHAFASVEHPNDDANRSDFFQHVSPFWAQIEAQLVRSYMSDLREMENAVVEIARLIEEFLQYIGVSMSRLPDGSCGAHFDAGFYDRSDD